MEINVWKNIKTLLSDKKYLILIILVAIASFLPTFLCITHDRDDFNWPTYKNDFLLTGRFGVNIIVDTLGFSDNLQCSLVVNVLCVLFLLLSAVVFTAILMCFISDKYDIGSLTLFSCIYISYPLICEVFNYAGTNLCTCLGCFLVSLCVWSTLILWFKYKKMKLFIRILYIFMIAVILCLCCSSYEPTLIVYAFFMMFCLLCVRKQNKAFKSNKNILILFLTIVLFCVAAVVLRFAISKVIVCIVGHEGVDHGMTTIRWFQDPTHSLVAVVGGFAYFIFVSAIIYPPITLFLISAIIWIVFSIKYSIKNKDVLFLLISACCVMVMFAFTIMTGYAIAYRTCCSVFALMVAIVAFFVQNRLLLRYKQSSKKRAICKGVFVFIVLLQVVSLNFYFVLNVLRSNYDNDLLKKMCDNIEQINVNDKPIVFELKQNEYVPLNFGVEWPESLVSLKLPFAGNCFNDPYKNRVSQSSFICYLNDAVWVNLDFQPYIDAVGSDVKVYNNEDAHNFAKQVLNKEDLDVNNSVAFREYDDFCIVDLRKTYDNIR